MDVTYHFAMEILKHVVVDVVIIISVPVVVGIPKNNLLFYSKSLNCKKGNVLQRPKFMRSFNLECLSYKVLQARVIYRQFLALQSSA